MYIFIYSCIYSICLYAVILEYKKKLQTSSLNSKLETWMKHVSKFDIRSIYFRMMMIMMIMIMIIVVISPSVSKNILHPNDPNPIHHQGTPRAWTSLPDSPRPNWRRRGAWAETHLRARRVIAKWWFFSNTNCDLTRQDLQFHEKKWWFCKNGDPEMGDTCIISIICISNPMYPNNVWTPDRRTDSESHLDPFGVNHAMFTMSSEDGAYFIP